ncbi:MAG: hypothetical protein ABGW69_00210 [Nanoarchaeota archaeon]
MPDIIKKYSKLKEKEIKELVKIARDGFGSNMPEEDVIGHLKEGNILLVEVVSFIIYTTYHRKILFLLMEQL